MVDGSPYITDEGEVLVLWDWLGGVRVVGEGARG